MAGIVCAVALVLSSCGSAAGGAAKAPAGDPVTGGKATIIQITEPRSLDPATMGNAWALNALVGNALYGTLLVNDPRTAELKPKLAESLRTGDNGRTFELTLRAGLTFSDGTPFDAEAVKFNWDRIKNPELGSSSIPEASLIASTTVVDTRTLKATLVAPVPKFGQAVVFGSLNWIASPKALSQGQEAFDREPVGAGPYTLESWRRQDVIELARNPRYWDAPKPYLDHLTLRTATDSTQRINTLISGGADVAIDTNWQTIAQARDAGFEVEVMTLNGGQYLTLNTRKAPFDDVRARRAVAAALDLDAINQSVYDGKGKVPRTLFTESSPYFSDISLARTDRDTAQRLFDELAAEGRRVSFTFKSFPSPESKATSESVQAQLSTFRNVEVEVETIDHTEVAAMAATHDFDMIISSALFVDPEPRLWAVFHRDSRSNMSGIDDGRLAAALDKGRHATTQPERDAAYEEVQRRLAELVPVIFYTRGSPAVALGKHTYGAVQYGNGSLLPEELWLQL